MRRVGEQPPRDDERDDRLERVEHDRRDAELLVHRARRSSRRCCRSRRCGRPRRGRRGRGRGRTGSSRRGSRRRRGATPSAVVLTSHPPGRRATPSSRGAPRPRAPVAARSAPARRDRERRAERDAREIGERRRARRRRRGARRAGSPRTRARRRRARGGRTRGSSRRSRRGSRRAPAAGRCTGCASTGTKRATRKESSPMAANTSGCPKPRRSCARRASQVRRRRAASRACPSPFRSAGSGEAERAAAADAHERERARAPPPPPCPVPQRWIAPRPMTSDTSAHTSARRHPQTGTARRSEQPATRRRPAVSVASKPRCRAAEEHEQEVDDRGARRR